MTNPAYDVIVIGAGSVGLPTALSLAERGLKVLVLEALHSPGQGQNKSAIGGVRATHSDPAKIMLCRQSLEIFSTWREVYGDDIGWKQGGYCFPVYRETEETLLKNILPGQKCFGLNIDWVGPDELAERVPGIRREGLRGGTFSPGDGQISPLMSARAFTGACLSKGVDFRFLEPVTAMEVSRGRIASVTTPKGTWCAEKVVIAAGGEAARVGRLAGVDLPVVPDSHEAGVTAPVAPFLDPLVVDLRPGPDGRTANFYFGQNAHGALIFCYTPREKFLGTDLRETSEFMPVLARRMTDLIPRAKNFLVRRVWRGLYPMTPDGIAIVGAVKSVENLYVAVGMCGQGFMMGPGVGRNLAALIADGEPEIDPAVFDTLRFERDFRASEEALK